jgi:hypothetical protein
VLYWSYAQIIFRGLNEDASMANMELDDSLTASGNYLTISGPSNSASANEPSVINSNEGHFLKSSHLII